jgi:hypothetical protein
MRTVIVSLLFGGATVVAAAALSPKAVDYLKELGIDANSAEVASIIDDQTGSGAGSPFTIEVFATRRSESGVRNFIAMRNFIRKYLLDTKTPFPPNDVYHLRYLKPEEVQFIRTALGGKLQPASAAFLQELGIDPVAEEITAILNDQMGTWSYGFPYSLDSLAAMRDENGVMQFIATRNFARKYLKDPKTKFPPREVYETKYLKEDEVQFILNELKKPFALLKG